MILVMSPLQRQGLQVEHQPGVVRKRGWDAHRTVDIRLRVVRRRTLSSLNLPFDLSDAVEILIDTRAIGCRQDSLQARNVRTEGVE